MEEKCENCPAKDICGSQVEELAMRLRQRYAEALATLTAGCALSLSIRDMAEQVSLAFLAGYMARVLETVEEYDPAHAPDLDMDVWGQAFK